MDFVLQEYHRNTPDEDLINDVKRVAEIYKKNSLTGKDSHLFIFCGMPQN